jgi:proliferating cell nuclear antigen PCNA
MTVIFKAKTSEGYAIKILAELLQNNLKTGCFEVDSEGIKLRMMDHHRTILIDIDLESDNFSMYKFNGSEKLFLGINLSHFHKMLKTIKKRDSIQFFIDDENPIDLGIKVIPKENNRVTTSFIKIQNIQNLDIDLPDGYGKPVIVPSGEFQKMCKGLTHISNLTHITSKGFLIRFSSDAGGVMKRYTEFGETEDSDRENENDDPDYDEEFNTEQLSKITKISGFCNNMQIFPKNGKPLLFRTNIGSLGKVSIFLKSKSLQEVESRTMESDDE